MDDSENEPLKYLTANDPRIAELVLNRPTKLNAISDQMSADLITALYRAEDDNSVNVIVVTGSGRAFCSGVDVHERQSRPRDELENFAGPQGRGTDLGRLGMRLAHYKPIVCAVQGYAIGAGLRLALRCDIFVAERGAKFQATQLLRGLSGLGLWMQIKDRCGEAFANEVSMTGRMFDAEEAFDRGLVSILANKGEGRDEALRVAGEIANQPATAVRALVRGRRRTSERLEYWEHALGEADRLYLSDDFKDRVQSFVEEHPKKVE